VVGRLSPVTESVAGGSATPAVGARDTPDVILLSLVDPASPTGTDRPRVPILACADALRAAGARVDPVAASSDEEIDAAVKPVIVGTARLIIAAATDAEIRAVVRRLVRNYAPPPSRRPAQLPDDRTVFDLPAFGLLPLAPAIPALVERLALPADPAKIAVAVLGGTQRRLDLLRNDAGSVTLHGALIGGADSPGAPMAWHGRIEVDSTVLTEGDEPVIVCSIRNAGSSQLAGLPLVVDARPDDGVLDVAVAVPVLHRHLLREASARVEVRRARGRAVSVTPRDNEVAISDDGVASRLTRKRSWWIERGAWAVYVDRACT
jgi:hypothetical protein